MRDLGWMDRSLCANEIGDESGFFSEKGGDKAVVNRAKKICGRCDVKAECLEWALDLRIDEGVFGGLSRNERRKLRRSAA